MKSCAKRGECNGNRDRVLPTWEIPDTAWKMDSARAAREDHSVSYTGKEVSITRALRSVHSSEILGGSQPGSCTGTTEGFEGKPTVTCRIDRHVVEGEFVTLRISGRITGENVNLLQAVLEQEKLTVTIDLKDVLLIDRNAARLLAGCESHGAELRDCPLYIREWITRERATGKS
jgi:hypothetical protein